ncbi:MAG: YajQ family cyclic di-GMP-binding protein [bacterium]|nr:MAG: YajQ family cyclic di-GMP-binding protein [bacterium]
MASFDIVSRVDMQEMDNAVNNARKEIQTRYDLRQSHSEIILDRKERKIRILAEDRMKLKAIQDILISHAVRRKIDAKALFFGEPEGTAKGHLRCEGAFQQGIDGEMGRRIVRIIKDTRLKVQAAVQDDQVRVTGKKIDDLQDVITRLKEEDLAIPLQFVNMKS